jgi:hypothetical protein
LTTSLQCFVFFRDTDADGLLNPDWQPHFAWSGDSKWMKPHLNDLDELVGKAPNLYNFCRIGTCASSWAFNSYRFVPGVSCQILVSEHYSRPRWVDTAEQGICFLNKIIILSYLSGRRYTAPNPSTHGFYFPLVLKIWANPSKLCGHSLLAVHRYPTYSTACRASSASKHVWDPIFPPMDLELASNSSLRHIPPCSPCALNLVAIFPTWSLCPVRCQNKAA